MHLAPLELSLPRDPIAPRAAALLADARRRFDAWSSRPGYRTGIDLIPSDYEQVWPALVEIRREHPDARRFLEWGSGLGVIAGLAAILGFEAYGIELDPELVDASQDLQAAHGLDVNFATGSFVPDSFVGDDYDDLETRTALGHPDAYDALGCDLDDFDVVYGYAWPTEEELYREIFRHGADYGAIFVNGSRLEGVRAWRKTGRITG